MHAQQPDFGASFLASVEQRGETLADRSALARKAAERDTDSVHVEREGSPAIEDVNPRVHREKRKRNRGALVIAGDDDDRDSVIGDALQGLERAEDESRFHTAA